MDSTASRGLGAQGLGQGKGLGKGLRHRKVTRDNIMTITKGSIRRLARRGGIKRIGSGVYAETRVSLRKFLEEVLQDAIAYTDHAKRQTVSVLDITYALKRQGRTIYGFT
jgi:histone H4